MGIKLQNGLSASIFVLSADLISACSTHSVDPLSSMQPAYIVSADSETLAKVSDLIAEHKGISTVKLGGIDKNRATTIPVLPLPLGPYETLSLKKPEIFKVFLTRDGCVIKSEGSGDEIALADIRCKLDQ